MRWAGSLELQYAILHHFKPTRQSVVSPVEIASLLHEVSWKRAGSFFRAGSFLKSEPARLVSSHSFRYIDVLAYAWIDKKQQQNTKIRMWKSLKFSMLQKQAQVQMPNLNGDFAEDLLKPLSNFKTVKEFYFGYFFLCFNFVNRVFGFTILE